MINEHLKRLDRIEKNTNNAKQTNVTQRLEDILSGKIQLEPDPEFEIYLKRMKEESNAEKENETKRSNDYTLIED